MDIKNIVENAKQKLAELTGFTSPSAIGVNREGETWRILIEITEKTSPASNLEVLGIYEVRLDVNGNFLGYERKKMRKRCDIQREPV
ncbi:MAG: gas vesicle protein GvpO [Bacteroidota bacterium]|nr:gas vesicle protein GvpO [Bacteroidota bacterium]